MVAQALEATHRTVAVLGPIPRDHIITHTGNALSKYGCALYTTLALSALLGDEGTVLPIVNVAEQDEAAIKALLATRPNIDVTGVRAVGERGDVVELRFLDQNNRVERQTGFMAPIRPEDVQFALHADAFVCVPITDYEVSQSTLAYIRANSSAVIMLDGHGPTSTISTGGERVRRLWIDLDEWLPSIDILKMNVEEAGCSWNLTSADAGSTSEMELEEIEAFADHALSHGVKALCVTLDERGCVGYSHDDVGRLVASEVGRIPISDVVDTTGCGDSFAAGLSFGYLLDGDIVTACQYGNAMGAQRAAATELDAYLSFERTSAQISAAYPASQR